MIGSNVKILGLYI